MLHREIDFSKYGGFPFDQSTLEYLQSTYRDIARVLKYLVGDRVIITGVEDKGDGEYSDGWIIFDNMLVPFIGGKTTDATFKVNAVVDNVKFEDTQLKPVLLQYLAVTTEGGTKIETLQRLKDFSYVSTKLADLSEHYEKNIITCYYDFYMSAKTDMSSFGLYSPKSDNEDPDYHFGRRWGGMENYIPVKCDNNDIPSNHWDIHVYAKKDNTIDTVGFDVWRHRTFKTTRFDGEKWIDEKIMHSLQGEVNTRLWLLLVRKNYTVPLYGNSLISLPIQK